MGLQLTVQPGPVLSDMAWEASRKSEMRAMRCPVKTTEKHDVRCIAWSSILSVPHLVVGFDLVHAHAPRWPNWSLRSPALVSQNREVGSERRHDLNSGALTGRPPHDSSPMVGIETSRMSHRAWGLLNGREHELILVQEVKSRKSWQGSTV